MNKAHDYRALEREYITTDVSIRELCRKHGISAHSLVTVQAKKGKWQEKREQYQRKASEAYLSRDAARMADRQAEIENKALDAIDEAIDKFREDLRATKPVRQPDGSITEMPAWYMKPRDLCLLIDRFEVLFGRPSVINQHQGLSVTSEMSVDALRDFLEATRGMGGPSRMDMSPLPRKRLDDWVASPRLSARGPSHQGAGLCSCRRWFAAAANQTTIRPGPDHHPRLSAASQTTHTPTDPCTTRSAPAPQALRQPGAAPTLPRRSPRS